VYGTNWFTHTEGGNIGLNKKARRNHAAWKGGGRILTMTNLVGGRQRNARVRNGPERTSVCSRLEEILRSKEREIQDGQIRRREESRS